MNILTFQRGERTIPPNHKKIGIIRLRELLEREENISIAETGTVFIQFLSTQEGVNIQGLKNWLFDKLSRDTFPKYNQQFGIGLTIEDFSGHLEIQNLHLLPEEKIKKIMNLFKWTEKKLKE